jgi:hypothetical protein
MGIEESTSGQLMPIEDGIRWNLRYEDEPRDSFELPRSLLLDHANLIPSQGLALDLAMGLGGNASYLIKHGLQVIGVDISSVAVHRAKRKHPSLIAVVADLEQFYIPPNTFALITDFLYLQRELWIPMTQGLKMGGIMMIECLTAEMLTIHPEINVAFLLKPGELKGVFLSGEIGRTMDIVYYHEGWQSSGKSHRRAVASLIARRIA